MTANRSDLATLLWVHDLARISKREYMHDFAAWLNADDLLCGASAAIAEHVVREEEDVGAYQNDQARVLD